MFEINYSQLIQYEILEKLVTYITLIIRSYGYGFFGPMVKNSFFYLFSPLDSVFGHRRKFFAVKKYYKGQRCQIDNHTMKVTFRKILQSAKKFDRDVAKWTNIQLDRDMSKST